MSEELTVEERLDLLETNVSTLETSVADITSTLYDVVDKIADLVTRTEFGSVNNILEQKINNIDNTATVEVDAVKKENANIRRTMMALVIRMGKLEAANP
jgi:hypothetical protein